MTTQAAAARQEPAPEETPATRRRVLTNENFTELLGEPLDAAWGVLREVGRANGMELWSGLVVAHVERCLAAVRGNMTNEPAAPPVAYGPEPPTTDRPKRPELDRAVRALRTVRTVETILYMAAIAHIGACCSEWHAERLRQIREEETRDGQTAANGKPDPAAEKLGEDIRRLEEAVARIWPLDARKIH